MADKRMFAKTIVLSDAFLDMPMSARCLYFTLGMLADDDGFVNQPRSVMRQCGASEDDMKVLIAKKFVIVFENGVIVIKHWRINNYLRNDRYKETAYIEEKEQLVTDKNGGYHLKSEFGIPNNGIPSIDKNRLDKKREDIYIAEETEEEKPKSKKYASECEEIINYLNSKAGTHYRNVESNRKLITARMKEGFSVDDFKTVIDKKCAEWVGTDMQQFIRPVTLFQASKFENYLNAPIKTRQRGVVIPMPETIREQVEGRTEEPKADFAWLDKYK